MKQISVLILTLVWACTQAEEVKVYDVLNYGAKPNGKTMATAAIQEAIDDCSADGGGLVRVSGGRFLTGTLFLKNDVNLEISEGTTLLGSGKLEDYPISVPDYRSYTDNYTVRSLIYAEKQSNIALTGKGTIDFQGALFQPMLIDIALSKGIKKRLAFKNYKKRPHGIRFISCQNIRVEDIHLRHSQMWMMHCLASDDISIRGIDLVNMIGNPNNDGLDIDDCHRVLIENCRIETGDDAVCLKSTSGRECRDVTVQNCTLISNCNPFKCGTESHSGFKNVTVTNCVIKPSVLAKSHTGLAGIALETVDGATMDNVHVSDIVIERGAVKVPIFIRLGNRARIYKEGMEPPEVGKLANVSISNIDAVTDYAWGCAIAGIPGHPIENLSLSDLNFTFPGGGEKEDRKRKFKEKEKSYPECNMFGHRLPAYGLFFWYVNGLSLKNIDLKTETADARESIVMENVSDVKKTR